MFSARKSKPRLVKIRRRFEHDNGATIVFDTSDSGRLTAPATAHVKGVYR